jgi:hypothetical protein
MMRRAVNAFLLDMFVCLHPAKAATAPWAPEKSCNVRKANTSGLYPKALSALAELFLDHRVTQALNRSTAPSNYHAPDGSIEGSEFTGAADISVRCLSEEQIKELLTKLAKSGFAAWYRKPGADGWTDVAHVHAVWVRDPLKPVLKGQVKSWLEGRNGLRSNMTYKFWQPSNELRASVRSTFEAANSK